MPPNTIEVISYPQPEEGTKDKIETSTTSITVPSSVIVADHELASNKDEGNYYLQIFQSTLNLLAHILIGASVGVLVLFAFRNGLPLGATPLHIVLCVIGYQLLMTQAILSLSPHNGWSSKLKLTDKKRAHTILQVVGSALAIAGSFIKMLDKAVNFNSLHGQFALVALVFTSVCLVNGLASLYAYELRGILPGNLSKITHICFGIVAFVAATISLCYGMDKNMFKNWATIPGTYTVMAFIATFTFIIIINPVITFSRKSYYVLNR